MVAKGEVGLVASPDDVSATGSALTGLLYASTTLTVTSFITPPTPVLNGPLKKVIAFGAAALMLKRALADKVPSEAVIV